MTRPSRRLLLLALLTLTLVGARQRTVRPDIRGANAPRDIFSFSEPNRIRVHHLDLDLDIDFSRRVIEGTATLDLVNLTATRTLILDTRDLDILHVTADGTMAGWRLGAPSDFGRPLSIDIEPSTREVAIRYITRPQAVGLYWMSAMQSFGRVAPYLYSQNEPDFARSWIPIQDTPAVRMTYSATVRVPPGLMALMSAENPTALKPDGVYSFRMPYPIPAYLVAIAAGRLEFRPLDERGGIYAEPELLDNAVYEMQYIPEMIDAAERIAGPYPFGRYDVLLMPPTYILGGMEHPRLNFLNPFSVVTGNRPSPPLPALLTAHELAHSWAGDLTTLATWSDVWLNEGITSYLTLRILEELMGPQRAELGFFLDRSAYSGFADNAAPSRTVMHREFQPGEPAAIAFSATAYLKGELFMKMLEDSLGREALDTFLREYFRRLSWRWVDDQLFLQVLRDTALQGRPELESELRLEEWIYEPGIPSNITAPTRSAIHDRVMAEVNAFRAGKPARDLATQDWTTIELDLFLANARNAVQTRMPEVDATFGLSMRNTPPLTWLLAAVEAQYQPADAAIRRILMRGGANSWIRALYETMSRNTLSRETARSIFQSARERYDPGVQQYVEQLLFGQQTKKRAA